jgi:hypothetical protein
MKLDRRHFLGGTAALLGTASAAAQLPRRDGGPVVRPEDFGARGDGVTNDTQAFARMSMHVERAGGGVIELRRTVYLVGSQRLARPAGRGSVFEPEPIISLRNLNRPLIIRGNGATLKCAPGLHYGTFDPVSGRRVDRPMPNFRVEEVRTPYRAMVLLRDCRASIEVADLELDGSLPQLIVGGPYGDTGHQIAAVGLFLQDNDGPELIRNVDSHHHGQDGVQIDGLSDRRARSRLENVHCAFNGRQGLSFVGGRGYDFERCRFNHTGRSAVASAPGAGVDIEAEGGKTNRDLVFTDCEFRDNFGCGMVADSGDSGDVLFRRCLFVGTTAWGAWPHKPRFRFEECRFVGAIVRAFPSHDPRQATQFVRCTFFDDPAVAGARRVYLQHGDHGTIADFYQAENVLFEGCTIRLTRNAQLPWTVSAIYRDTNMSQASARPAYPRGRFQGRVTIDGPVDLYASRFEGSLILNGQPYPPRS